MPNPTHDPIASILGHVEDLSVHHAHWAGRDPDPTTITPGARQAASDAISDIDATLRALHQLRSQLITETHRHDDAFGAYIDAKYGLTPGGVS